MNTINHRDIPDSMIINMVRIALSEFLYQKSLMMLGGGIAAVPSALDPLYEIHSIVMYFSGFPDMTYDDCGYSDEVLEQFLTEYEAILQRHIDKLQKGNITTEIAESCYKELCEWSEKHIKHRRHQKLADYFTE